MKWMLSIFVVAVVSLSAFAGVEITSKHEFGKYTSDLAGAKAAAKKYKRFIIEVQAKNDGSCQFCNQACSATYGIPDVLSWAKSNHIPLVYGDGSKGTSSEVYQWTKRINNGATSYPTMGIADMDGETSMGSFRPLGSVTTSFSGGKICFGSGLPGLQEMVHALVNAFDDKPSHAWEVSIEKDPTKDASAFGMYYGYAVNSLKSASNSTTGTSYGDEEDWYVVTGKPSAGKVLMLKQPSNKSVNDKKGVGFITVYKNLNDANANKNPLIKAVPILNLTQGILVPGAGNGAYIKVYTKNINATVNYSLLVTEGEPEDPLEGENVYAFAEGAQSKPDDASSIIELTVKCLKGEAGGKVSFSVDEQSAVEGVDFDIVDKDGQVTANRDITFPAGAKETKLRVRINSDGGLWKGDRKFTLKLASGEPEEGQGYSACTVTIVEKHPEMDEADPGDDVESGATPIVAEKAVSARLNTTDVTDWYTCSVSGLVSKLVILRLEPTATNLVGRLTLAATNETIGVAEALTAAVGTPAEIKFSPKAEGMLTFQVSRQPVEGTPSALYKVSVTVDPKWVKPEISFEKPEMTVSDTNDVCKIKLVRTNSLTAEDRVQVVCTPTPDVRDASFPVTTAVFSNGVSDLSLDLLPNVADNQGFWKGDRTYAFDLQLADDRFCTTGAYTKVQLTLKETEEEYEEGDPDKDGVEDVSNPGVNTELVALSASQRFARTLHGGDQQDFFTFTGAKVGERVQFSVRTNGLRNVENVWLVATVNGVVSETVPLASVDGMVHPITVDGNIKVKVFRKEVSSKDKPVSCRYELGVALWEPPAFSFEEAELNAVDDTNNCFVVKVKRTGNLAGRDVLDVTTSNVTAFVKGSKADPQMDSKVECVFEPEVAETNVLVRFTPEDKGVRTGDRTFELGFDFRDRGYRMTAGEHPTARITLTDVDKELDGTDPGDDTLANPNHLSKILRLTKSNAAKVSADYGERRLNGRDRSDWYVFDNVPAETNFCVGAMINTNALNNLGPEQVLVEFRASRWDPTLPGFIFDQILGTNTLAELASVEWTCKPTNACSIAVCVFRPEEGDDASLAYDLTYRLQPPREVRFVSAGDVKVDEAAAAAYVDLNLVMEDPTPLEEEVSAILTPQVDEAAPYPAKPDEDFDPRPVTVTWPVGSVGGVVRAAVPLTNYATDWEGEESFKVVLSSGTAEVGEDVERRIVIAGDKDAAPVGTVGLTALGLAADGPGEKPSASRTYEVVSGGKVRLGVTRVNGKAGKITGVFTWKDSKKKTVAEKKVLLFEGKSAAESAYAEVTNDVPSGLTVVSSSLTLSFSVSKNDSASGADVTSGTPKTLKFTVRPADYEGSVAAYAAGDRAKLAFTASKSEWYLASDGRFVSVTPGDGKSVVLKTTVTGPATLKFTAQFTAAVGCTLTTKAGSTTVITNGTDSGEVPVAIAIPAGNQSVTITFKRPKTAAKTAKVAITGITVDRGGTDFYAIGTFTGPVYVDAAAGEAVPVWPGLGQFTVAASGKVSGKIQCPDRTWTVDAKATDLNWEPYTEDPTYTGYEQAIVTAKSGTAKFSIRLVRNRAEGWLGIIQVPGGSGRGAQGYLGRVPWSDKPLEDTAAAVIRDYPGYYTMAISGGNSDEEKFGSGYLTITVSASGKMKASGRLADGTALSLSGYLLQNLMDDPRLVFYAAPAAYAKRGWYLQYVTLGLQDGRPVLNGFYDTEMQAASPWHRHAADGTRIFDRVTSALGGLYGTGAELAAHYAGMDLEVRKNSSLAGTKTRINGWIDATEKASAADENHPVLLRFNAKGTKLIAEVGGEDKSISNPFSIGFTRATGIFQGNFRVQYAYEMSGTPRTYTKSATYRGVMVPWRKDVPEDPLKEIEGFGYFLIDGVSHGIEIQRQEGDW